MMKKKMIIAAICTVSAAALMTGCGSSGRSEAENYEYNDYQEEDDGGYSGNAGGRKSILEDPNDYEYGENSEYQNESAHDPRFDDASWMYNYEGRTFSSHEVDLEFELTSVSDNGNQIQVVFDKCQYPLSGIDLGTTYTGYLEDISGGYAAMEGVYRYAVPFMDLWEDGSRHEDTYYLEFSFGSTDENGEFCMSEIGLLNDTMFMQ